MMKKLLKKFIIGSLVMSITFSSAIPVFATETTDNNTTDDGTDNSTDNNTDNSTDNTDGSTANGTESTTTSSSNLQGAEKIINTYIQMAKGSTVADEDVNALTEAELRFLGIYVSNFYVPFGTELGSAGNDDDNTTQNKEDIKKTLQTQLKFSDDLADQLTEKILSLARGTAVELSFAFSKEYQSGYKEVGIAPNYYNFARCMAGRTDSVLGPYTPEIDGSYLKDNDNAADAKKENKSLVEACQEVMGYTSEGEKIKFDSKSKYKYGYLGYTKDGTFTPVCDFYVDYKDGYTASQIGFLKCLESVQLSKGYGFSDLDFTKGEEVDDKKLQELTDATTKDEASKMSFYGSKMYVDCFGDIISVGGNHQYIAVPGAMNTYTWVSVDSSGSDNAKPGEAYILANSLSMVKADKGEMFRPQSSSGYTKSKDDKDYNGIAHFTLNPLKNNLLSMKTDCEQGKKSVKVADGIYPMPAQRGTTDCKVKDYKAWNPSSTMIDFMKKARDGFIASHKGDLTYRYSTPNLKGSPLVDNWFKVTYTIDIAMPKEGYFKATNDNKINTNIVMVDSLGAYEGSDGSEVYNAFNVASYVDDNGKSQGSDLKITFGSNTFDSVYNNIKSGSMEVPEQASEAAMSSLYTTYIWACLYDDSNKDKTIGKLGYRLDTDNLPELDESKALDAAGGASSDKMLTAIRNWLYYLLHPTDGYNYVRLLITNKVNRLLIGWHNAMVGTHGVGATTGTTLYRSNTGYVTTPDLSEIEWTSSILSFYNSAIPFLIVAMIVVMLFAFISGVLSLQRSIFGVFIFTLFLMLPSNLINNVVGYSNRIAQNIYGEKFTYWALIQQESYASAIEKAASGESTATSSDDVDEDGNDPNASTDDETNKDKEEQKKKEEKDKAETDDNSTDDNENEDEDNSSSGTSDGYQNYLRTLYANNQKVYSNQGTESIVLKWQAPKKMASLMLSKQDNETISGLSDAGRKMFLNTIGNAYSGESYVDNDESTYLYRSYLDISNFSRYIYRGIKEGTRQSKKALSNDINKKGWSENLQNATNVSTMRSLYEADRNAGYCNKDDKNNSTALDKTIRITVPMSSKIVNDAMAKKDTIKSMKIKDYVGINKNLFNFSIPLFNKSEGSVVDYLKANTENGTDEELKQIETDAKNYSEADFVGLAAYGLYSENVFYYFSWDLYDTGLEPNLSNDGYKNLLLGDSNAGYFYNTLGNGDLKDFMDMRSLFTYIIPYLKECNDVVHEWDDTYGLFLYSGVPYDEGHWNDSAIKGNEQMQQKYWHNLNVARLYGLYCPWVDVMYECNYAKSEKIHALGNTYVIEDPLNPASYPKDRPMIFSESEMNDYGMDRGDLTNVERLILNCNEGMEERMYELLNYYSFSDVTLDTAAAMNCAFEFNNTFSQNGIFTSNHNIYPQSYELADFSYDAFLRFILANTTGESLTNQNDFYENIVVRSSTTTAIVLIILDIISCYILPAFKIFFIIAVFLASIFIIITTAFRVDPEQKFIRKVINGVVIPMIEFMVITVGFAYVISLFMGVGNNAVTQTNKPSIQMGDPVVVMFAMIAIDVIVLVLYFRVLKNVCIEIKSCAKASGNFVSGVAGGTLGVVAGMVAASAIGKTISSGIGGGSASGGSSSGNTSEDGTGSSSPRAESRSKSRDSVHDAEDRHSDPEPISTRRNDARRETIRNSSRDEMSDREKTERINRQAESGLFNLHHSDEGISDRLRNRSNKVKDSGKHHE